MTGASQWEIPLDIPEAPFEYQEDEEGQGLEDDAAAAAAGEDGQDWHRHVAELREVAQKSTQLLWLHTVKEAQRRVHAEDYDHLGDPTVLLKLMKIYRSSSKETESEVVNLLRNISTYEASRPVFCNIGCAGIVLSRMLALHSDLLHLKHDESKKKGAVADLERTLADKEAELQAAGEYEEACREEARGLRKEAVAKAKRSKIKLSKAKNAAEKATVGVANMEQKLKTCAKNIGAKYTRLCVVMEAVGNLSACGNFVADSLSREADLMVVLGYAVDSDVSCGALMIGRLHRQCCSAGSDPAPTAPNRTQPHLCHPYTCSQEEVLPSPPTPST